MSKFLMAASLAGLALLQGCATPVEPLYNWGPYERQVSAHFKGESPESQIQILEQHAVATKSSGKVLPPGYMAHLGLLYGKAGRDADFVAALEEEKRLFPESAPYINQLLHRVNKGATHDVK